MMASAILSDRIPCKRLAIEDSSKSSASVPSLPKSQVDSNMTPSIPPTVKQKVSTVKV